MIILEFDIETHNPDGTLKPRVMYWLGTTNVIGEDEEHTDEIYEQLDAQTADLA
jgi:hypothetical protein